MLQPNQCSLSLLNLDAEGILVKDVLSHLKDWDHITRTENIKSCCEYEPPVCTQVRPRMRKLSFSSECTITEPVLAYTASF